MQVQIPLFILCLLVHAGIFLTSAKPDRRLRFMAGLAVLFATWPAWYSGVILSTSGLTTGQGGMAWLVIMLVNAPYYLPLLSFLVYWRRR